MCLVGAGLFLSLTPIQELLFLGIGSPLLKQLVAIQFLVMMSQLQDVAAIPEDG